MEALLALAFAAVAAAPLSAQSAMVSTSGGGRSEITMTVPLGRTATINRMAVRPLRVVEDSRCPINVQCVWAGRLVVLTRIDAPGGGEELRVRLEMGKPMALYGGQLTLVGAIPAKRTGGPPPRSFILRYRRG